MTRARRLAFVSGFASFAVAWLLFIGEILLGQIDTGTHWFGANYALRIDGGTLIIWRHFSQWIVIEFPRLSAPVFALSGIICLTVGIVCHVRDFAARREQERAGFEIIAPTSNDPTQAPGSTAITSDG